MLRILASALFALLLVTSGGANAQQALTIKTCGSPPDSLDIGSTHVLYMDSIGVLCTSAGGGGSSSTPFTPNGNFGTLTATAASSASTALPSGATVAFQNTSTIDVSCVLASGAATATANKIVVRGGATVFVAVGSNVNTACINQSGSASNVVVLAGGTGLGTNFGGGGSGGGGGAITAASGAFASGSIASGAYASGSIGSGAMVDLGAIADAAATAGSTGSLSAKLRLMTTQLDTLNTNVTASIPAGSNSIGVVGADPSKGGATPASAAINVSTATTTQLVAISGTTKIYVTSFDVVAAGTGNITLVYGTGASCGTGTTSLTGAYNLTAQAGIAKGNGVGAVLVVPAGNALCVTTSAAVQMSGSVSYQQF